MKYDPEKIEKKWQKYWRSKKMYQTKDEVKDRPNFMLAAEFPYTSGNLHIGHWYTFGVSDALARYLRMNGYNVLYPIGFDAFGLPAENAAIKHGSTPEEWTKKNISNMTKQLMSIGATFDWSRSVDTSDPNYYKWTQWMFLKMYERGLAYRATTKVNWCPKDKTVLANEQVVNGRCERCDTEVEQKEKEQWMYKITDYADRLVDDIEGLDWPQTTRLAQRNWIGRSEGAIIKFPLVDVPGQPDKKHFVEVFTTRADTIFGATFVVVSPELAQKWIDVGWLGSSEHGEDGQVGDEVKDYVKKSLTKRDLERMEEKEKTGVFSGVNVINPLSEEKIPVWVADYVLGSYGTGAIMAVPAHDERDLEFASKFKMNIRKVVMPQPVNVNVLASPGSAIKKDTRVETECFSGEGEVINSGDFSGLLSVDANKKIVAKLKAINLGDFKKTYRLRDWVLSRQRYWGVPIPVIKCASCGYVPVPDEELPVELPKLKDFKPTDDGRSPLAKASKWVNVKCPKCGEKAERETDTMDTFVDSSWYFMRYTDPSNKNRFADEQKIKAWLPMPMYVGGPEHNTMHLLYARFFTKALHDLGYLDFSEPFTRRRNHSVILGPDGSRMSKSRGNVVDPDKEVASFGADTVRMYLAFMGPYSDQTMPWDPKGVYGVHRFINRVWKLYGEVNPSKETEKDITVRFHQAIKKVGGDIKEMRYNTAVSELMKLLNDVESYVSTEKGLENKYYEVFLKLLAPLAPHVTEEIWMNVLKKKSSIHLESWPKYDEALLVQDSLQIPVQVNGKVRDVITVPVGIGEEELKKTAQETDKIKSNLSGKKIVKIIVVPKKLINIVVAGD